ncbi:DUF6386 family protein [Pantoea sp. CCBC3-3-1]|uniref:DUF6386 family protein n=1 Tax=Pantoea sp. CCBC3-3-1 TaxID=2490851 RepID=UPI0011BE2B7F|nr:DUF6386 family protein [Pantoea sp. CCBC3-3-1]
MSEQFLITTDTATLSIFDLGSLKHRINDDADWWSIPEDEINEINKGNVIFLNLGSDGQYEIKIKDEIQDDYKSLYLNVPTGKVYVGAGEDTTGGDLEPDGSDYMSGVMVKLNPGYYEVQFKKEFSCITLVFKASSEKCNNIEVIVRI